MLLLRFLLLAVLMASVAICPAQTVYQVKQGSISFNSDAPNEIIKASSKKLLGIINTEKKQFAFKADVSSFEGFNSPLQKEHFNENYMESGLYPQISFSGKIIEDVNLTIDGKYTIRAKGKLTIHGVSRDRIIYATAVVKSQLIDISSEFTVSLADHDIKIPRVVNDKLATEVFIVVKTSMMPQAK